MITLRRIVLPSINAFFITAALLYAMYLLIDMQEQQLSLPNKELKLDFIHIPEDVPVVTKILKPKELPEVEKPPKLITDDPKVDIVDIDTSDIFTEFTTSKGEAELFNLNDSQLVLAIGFPPSYPNSAITRGLEGYVVVGFSITTSGSVIDPYIIESEPGSTFDRAALKAIAKFKYKPKMVGGKPVPVDGQRYKFSFEMDD